jgi:hypothetical protein
MAVKYQGGKAVMQGPTLNPGTMETIARIKREVFQAERELVRALAAMQSVGRATNDPERLSKARQYLEMMTKMQGIIRDLTT